ncbi:MAG: insulinase family protein [Proteobacteria bacterium]|nr:insulinase family protein [Pseudomonadota bacterium]MCP4919936.1 insulinase family protein [Pseudomonadota bacterium]
MLLDALVLNPTLVVLDNGLTVVVHEDHRAPVVATSLLVGVGASEDMGPDGTGRTGKAHLFEHLMFEGSANVPQPDSTASFDELLAEVGANSNAWTSHDYTVYTMEGPPQALERMLWLDADRLGWLLPGISDEDIANQQSVVVQERLGDEASDTTYPMYALNWVLHDEGHPYRMPILGTTIDILNTDRAELEAFYGAWYTPNNAVLVIVGDVDADATVALVREHFKGVERGASPPDRAAEVPYDLWENPWVMIDDRDDPALFVTWPTVPRGHADEPALDILSLVLSGGPGTRLDDPLYYDRFRVSDLAVWTGNGRLGGEFSIWFERDDQPLAPILKRIDKELDRVKSDGVTQDEIDRMVGYWVGATLRSLEDPAVVADSLNDCFQTFGTPDCLASDLQRYVDLKPADLQRVASSYLGEKRVVLSVVAPGADERFAIPQSIPVDAP